MAGRPSRILSLLLSSAVALTANATLIPAAFAQTAPAADAKQSSGKVFSQQELDELLAPVALHPDALLAQILMASTYPLDVVETARWRKANPKLEGKALEDALLKQPWDPSVKALATFPTVLDMMSEKLEWTQKLGDAFLGQQKEVMQTVQKLRSKAKEAGSLASTKEQNVTTANEGGTTIIKIEQSNPEVVYVPTYNPAVVYGSWWYPVPPPYYYYPPAYVPGAAFFTFTAGVIVGGALWGNCNWGGNDININVNKYNNFNKTNISNKEWNHNTDRRRGVPYEGAGAQNRYGSTQARDNKARDEYRGRAEQGRQDLSRDPATRERAAQADRDLANDRARNSSRDTPSASSMDRSGSRDSAASRDRATANASASNRASTSDRSSAFGNSSQGQSARDYGSRGSSSRAGMSSSSAGARSTGGARAGGGGGRSGGGGRGR
ncbi:DUF3300 domain-containing protein [Niveibacterium sp. 24ML]|uniref:DUF3300 domain-containing protein n=1 Tax=Niveibacterium sp. 24ML TaxID=2985512 RepID=UPI0022704A2D|nr:DUF3300 domain-containing protein [Niveibacterium sp. 24ML]MCX9155764.1 DUF3300 domain-containing protein [Niveibacterium sp. 24ML]